MQSPKNAMFSRPKKILSYYYYFFNSLPPKCLIYVIGHLILIHALTVNMLNLTHKIGVMGWKAKRNDLMVSIVGISTCLNHSCSQDALSQNSGQSVKSSLLPIILLKYELFQLEWINEIFGLQYACSIYRNA